MKIKNVIGACSCMALLQCSTFNTECVSLDIGDANCIKLTAIVIDGGIKDENQCGCYVGEHQGKLVLHGGCSGSERLLTRGVLTLNGKKIDLDVSGLASPWVAKSDLTPEDCTLKKMEYSEYATASRNDCYHKLTIRFYKGGGNDYEVTWYIYRGKSIRVSIEDALD